MPKSTQSSDQHAHSDDTEDSEDTFENCSDHVRHLIEAGQIATRLQLQPSLAKQTLDGKLTRSQKSTAPLGGSILRCSDVMSGLLRRSLKEDTSGLMSGR